MANLNQPDTNTSQFLITFVSTEELYKKNTLFGRICGDSIFNLMKIEKVKVDAKGKPTADGVQIEAIRVVENPFDDIFVRDLKEVRPDLVVDSEAKNGASGGVRGVRGKKRARKNRRKDKKVKMKNLLSFGDEEEDDIDEELNGSTGARGGAGGSGKAKNSKNQPKMLSAFDLLKNDKTLSQEASITAEDARRMDEIRRKNKERQEIKDKILKKSQNGPNPATTEEEEGSLLAKRTPEKEINKVIIKEYLQKDILALKNNEVPGVNYKKNPRTGRYEIVFNSSPDNSRSSSSDSSSSSGSSDSEPEIMPTGLKFKENKTGSLNLRGRQSLAEEKKLLSRVELKRYKFLKNPLANANQHQDQNEAVSGVQNTQYMPVNALNTFNAPSMPKNVAQIADLTKKEEEDVYKFESTADRYRKKGDTQTPGMTKQAPKIQHRKPLAANLTLKEDSKGDSVLERLSRFKARLLEKKSKASKYSWMNAKLKFHIDSENAYKAVESKNRAKEIGGHGSFVTPGEELGSTRMAAEGEGGQNNERVEGLAAKNGARDESSGEAPQDDSAIQEALSKVIGFDQADAKDVLS